MRQNLKMLRLVFSAGLLCLLVATPLVWAEQRTITGTLNEADQLVTARGDVYEIADTEAGSEMLYEAFENVVAVTGEVVEDEEIIMITVSAYKIISKSAESEAEDSPEGEDALEDAQDDELEDPEADTEE